MFIVLIFIHCIYLWKGVNFMEQSFGDVLKKLIKFTGVKLSALAYFIGYDISYISKWTNGASRPSPKHIMRINSMLAQFFADEILSRHSEYLFLKEFDVQDRLPASGAQEFLRNQINNLLSNAYFREDNKRQASSAPVPEKKDGGQKLRLIVGRKNTYDFFCHELSEIIHALPDGAPIYLTGDIFDLIGQKKFTAFLDCCNLTDKRLDFYIGCSSASLYRRSEDDLYSLYQFLNKYFHVDFYIYDNTGFESANIFAAKDRFVIQYSLHSDKSVDICTYITDEMQVREVCSRISDKFFNAPLMLSPKKELVFFNVRSFFYLNNNFTFFNTNGFEFFLTPASFDGLIDKCREMSCPPEAAEAIKNLQIAWEEQFEKSAMVLILPEYNLMNYVQSGKLVYADVMYRTSPDERLAQLKHMLDVMKKNSKIKIYVLGQNESLNMDNYCRLAYYSNTRMAYFKKNKYLLKDTDKAIYLIKDTQLIKKFDLMFARMKGEVFSKSYSAEAIEALYSNNEALLMRMMQQR